MVPAQPPLPSWWYLPFHAVAGSQSANLISESLLGRIAPLTSQCAGTVIAGAVPAAPGPAGAENGPVGTMIAAVTTVRESFRLVRLSHDCCAKSGEAAIATVTAERTATNRANIDLLLKGFV